MREIGKVYDLMNGEERILIYESVKGEDMVRLASQRSIDLIESL